jgi:hypothetical protein
MNCDGVRDLLSAYLDGELSPGELLRVEQHLRRCHACADEVDSLRQTTALVASLEEVELPASFHAQLHERLVALGPPAAAVRRASHASTRQRQQRRWAVPAAAAAAVFAIGLTAYSSLNANQPDAGGLEAIAMFTQSPAGDQTGPGPFAVKPPDTGKDAPLQGTSSGTPTTNGQNPVTPPAQPDNTQLPVTTPPTVIDPDLGPTDNNGGPIVAVPGAVQNAPVKEVLVHSATVTLVKDDAKLAALQQNFAVKQAFDGGLRLIVPLQDFDASVAQVKEFFPNAAVAYQSQNVGPDMAAVNAKLARLNAEHDQLLKQASAERQDKAALQKVEGDIKAAEEERDLLVSEAGKATVILMFQTAAQ